LSSTNLAPLVLHRDRDAALIEAVQSILDRLDGVRPLLPFSPEEALLVLDVDGVRGYAVRARPEGPACECEAFRVNGSLCAHVVAAMVRWGAFYATRRRAIGRERAEDSERDAELRELEEVMVA
jgi:SWIM zinc finger